MGKFSEYNIIIATTLFLILAIFCTPGRVLAYDLNDKIKEFVGLQVQRSDQIINSVSTRLELSVNSGLDKINEKVLNGFARFEEKTRMSEQNKVIKYLYMRNKNDILKNVGFGLGIIDGTKDILLETYSFVAKIPTAPERTINLAYKVSENPEEYRNKISNGVKSAVGIATNPLPFLNVAYQLGRNTYIEARKDPVQYGKLNGELTAFGGSLLLGGGQLKALTTSQKVQKTTTIGKVTKAQKKNGQFIPVLGYSSDEEWLKDFKFLQQEIIKYIELKKTSPDEFKKLPAFELLRKATNIQIKTSWEHVIFSKGELKPVTLHHIAGSIIEGKALPKNRIVVDLVASMAGIGLDGINVNIMKTRPYLEKVDFLRTKAPGDKVLGGEALPGTINIYADAFQDPFTLVATLAHERMHVAQFEWYDIKTMEELLKYEDDFEKAAKAIEKDYVELFAKEFYNRYMALE